MSAKEYLQQIRRLDTEIKQHKRRIEELENEIRGLKAIDYSSDKVQSTPQDRMAAGVARLVELQNETTQEMILLQERKKRISSEINLLKNEQEASLLVFRYVDCLAWENIAVEMHISIRRVFQIHGTALNEFRKLNLF